MRNDDEVKELQKNRPAYIGDSVQLVVEGIKFKIKMKIYKGVTLSILYHVRHAEFSNVMQTDIRVKLYTNEPPRGKTNNVVSEQVRHKPTYTSTEKS